MISFPQSGTTTTGQTASETHSFTKSITPPPTSMPSNSNFNYLTTVSTLLLNTASPTPSVTVSNPDQPATTLSLLSVPPAAAPTAPPLPNDLPRVILPQPALDISSVPNSDTMINVLFNDSLNWPFVARNADSPGQIFEYFPTVIATALNINGMSFKPVLDCSPN